MHHLGEQKETPAKGRGFERSTGVCPCFHSVSFSPHTDNLAIRLAQCHLLTCRSLEWHRGAARTWSVGSPHRDSNSSHPLKVLRAFFFATESIISRLLILSRTPSMVSRNKKACHWGRPGDGVSKVRSQNRYMQSFGLKCFKTVNSSLKAEGQL